MGWPTSFLSHNRGVGPILTIIALQGTVSDHKQRSRHLLSAVLFSQSFVPLFKNANSLTFVYFYWTRSSNINKQMYKSGRFISGRGNQTSDVSETVVPINVSTKKKCVTQHRGELSLGEINQQPRNITRTRLSTFCVWDGQVTPTWRNENYLRFE